jgi:hypothetical protein
MQFLSLTDPLHRLQGDDFDPQSPLQTKGFSVQGIVGIPQSVNPVSQYGHQNQGKQHWDQGD